MEHRTTLPFTQFVERCVGGDPICPGTERRPSVEAGQTAYDLYQCLLAGVIGVPGTACDSATHRMDAVVVATQQLVERELIAALRGGDQGGVIEAAWNESSVPNELRG